MSVLLEQGADVNSINDHDDDPLLVATRVGHVALVKELLKNGASLRHRSKQEIAKWLITEQYEIGPGRRWAIIHEAVFEEIMEGVSLRGHMIKHKMLSVSKYDMKVTSLLASEAA